MKTLSIVLRVALTLGAIYGAYAMPTLRPQPTPHWLIWPLEGLLALAWGVAFWKLASVLDGLWALVLLPGLVVVMAALMLWLVPDGLPDWTVIPILGAATVLWLLLLRLGVSWQGTKAVAHAVTWLAILAIPAAVVVEMFSSVLANTLLGEGAKSNIGLVAEALAVGGVIVAALFVWVRAIRGRWSLKWPLVVLFVVCLRFTFAVFAVTLIGVGKLIIWAVGRGGTLAPSMLSKPKEAVRPASMMESTSNEW